MDRTLRVWNLFPDYMTMESRNVSGVGHDNGANTNSYQHIGNTGTSMRSGRGGQSTSADLLHDWTHAPDVITACRFTPDGKMCVVGDSRGQVLFYSYDKEGLRYFTQIDCSNSAGRWREGRIVRSFDFHQYVVAYPQISGPPVNREMCQMLVTTNDDRIRLVDLDDYSVLSKFKGHVNHESIIGASFSADGKYIISGSETGRVHIWSNQSTKKTVFESKLLDRKAATAIKIQEHESFFPGHSDLVTVAIFAPNSSVAKATQLNKGIYILDYIQDLCSRIIVAADSRGRLQVLSRGLDA